MIQFATPKRADINCRNCGSEIEATGEVRHDGPSIKGLRQYRWRHVATHEVRCRPSADAEPFSAWDATRLIEGTEGQP